MTDREGIYDVLVRYAEGLDRRDFDAVASCFTQDARARYAGIDVGPGIDAIMSFLRQALVSAASTHLVGNLQVTVDGDEASSVSTTIAVHVEETGDDGAVVRIRGLRYHDRLQRSGGSWRIADRVHEPIWTADAPGALLGAATKR